MTDSATRSEEELIQIARRVACIPEEWIASVIWLKDQTVIVHFDDCEPSPLGGDIMVTLYSNGELVRIEGGI